MAKSAAYVDYQQRASEFAVDDLVYLFATGDQNLMARVTAVWPAIGMVDVEWPHGSQRLPVEDLMKFHGNYDPPRTENIPGGSGTVFVPNRALVTRVAVAYLVSKVEQEQPFKRVRLTQARRAT